MLDHEHDRRLDRRASGFVRIPVSHETFDNRWMVRTVEEQQRGCWSATTSCSSPTSTRSSRPNPSYGTLGDYIERFDEPWVNCLGYELMHLADSEEPLRPTARPSSTSAATGSQRRLRQAGARDGADGLAARLPPAARTASAASTPTCASSTCTGWTTRSAWRATGAQHRRWNAAGRRGGLGAPTTGWSRSEEFDRWFTTDRLDGRDRPERIPRRGGTVV